MHFRRPKETLTYGMIPILPQMATLEIATPMQTATQPEMGGLGAETLGTETFVVSVPVSVPPRLKMSGLVKVSVSRDFILKSRSRSRFHETQNESLGLGLGSMRPKLKVSVSVSFLRPGKLLVSPITAF